jgi:hypothetical protein
MEISHMKEFKLILLLTKLKQELILYRKKKRNKPLISALLTPGQKRLTRASLNNTINSSIKFCFFLCLYAHTDDKFSQATGGRKSKWTGIGVFKYNFNLTFKCVSYQFSSTRLKSEATHESGDYCLQYSEYYTSTGQRAAHKTICGKQRTTNSATGYQGINLQISGGKCVCSLGLFFTDLKAVCDIKVRNNEAVWEKGA